MKVLAGDSLLSIEFLRDFALPTGSGACLTGSRWALRIGRCRLEEVTAVRTAVIDGMKAAGTG